jgi:hypothetical protein
MHRGLLTKTELIDYAIRAGAPLEVVERTTSMKMKDIRINGRNLARLSYGRRLSLNEG